jgi:hypothetical protein
MLDQLLQLVKEHAGEPIINNPAIPNELNEQAIATTSSSIFSSIQGAVAGGGLAGIMDLVKDGGSGIQGNVATSLAEKFGIDASQASSIAGSIVPSVIAGIQQKIGSGGFDIQSILANLTSGGGNLGDVLGNLTSSLDANKDGKTDLGDLGGLADGLKGLFK